MVNDKPLHPPIFSSFYRGQNGGNGMTDTNGYGEGNSPNSSHLSSEGHGDATLVSRTQKQHTTQKVTTTTKTIREIQYLGPDGQPLDLSSGGHPVTAGAPPPVHPRLSSSGSGPGNNYEQYNGYDPRYAAYGDYAGAPQQGYPPPNNAAAVGGYAEYPHRAPTPPSPSDRSASPPPQHREPGESVA